MNSPRWGAAAAALGLHAALALGLLGAGGQNAIDSGRGVEDLTAAATVSILDPDSLGPDFEEAERVEASPGADGQPEPAPPHDSHVDAEEAAEADWTARQKEPERKTDQALRANPAPASEAREEERATARDREAKQMRALSLYDRRVHQALSRAALRPVTAARGRVTVEMVIGASGALLAQRIIESSGNEYLDAAATASVRRAGPFSPPPRMSSNGDATSHVVIVPFDFAAHGRGAP